MSAKHVVVVGSGNAALCAGIAALEAGAKTTILEKADQQEAGGNSRYTAGAMRFAYANRDDILALMNSSADPRLNETDFGTYSRRDFESDMQFFNAGRPLSDLQRYLIDDSYQTMVWLKNHHVEFEPIYSRQSFEKNGRYTFWGGLTLEAAGEGVGLVEAELREYLGLGGKVLYTADCHALIMQQGRIAGVEYRTPNGDKQIQCDAVVLACGGFEANHDLRAEWMGEQWRHAKVRGTPHNTGAGLTMAMAVGGVMTGARDGCHAVPMDRMMPDYGNLQLPYIERKNYRKICYFLGVMLNSAGERFVDEGENFRNYTYAQFGRAILQQPGGTAWQVFDQKVAPLLYDEYRTQHATVVTANSLEDLVHGMDDIDAQKALQTLRSFNQSVDETVNFDPAILDGKCTRGLDLNKSNWANRLDAPPYIAYPVTCGITFTYAGLDIDLSAAVLNKSRRAIPGLFACGEMAGDIFVGGYPGGSGLTSGAVFGRLAGRSAAGL